MAPRKTKSEYTQSLTIKVKPSQYNAMKLAAARSGQNLTNWVRQALVERSGWTMSMDRAQRPPASLDDF